MKYKLKYNPQDVFIELFEELAPSFSIDLVDGDIFYSSDERENFIELLMYNTGIEKVNQILGKHGYMIIVTGD